MSDVIKNQEIKQEDYYYSWSSGDKDAAINALGKSMDQYGYSGQYRSQAGLNNYSNILPNTSGRPGMTRRDYESWRQAERVPTKIKDIICLAGKMYDKVGLIGNIIDLMGDFACQGVRISHPDKRIESFYKNWFKRVNGKERSERFLNNLYKTANIVIRRQTAKISLKDRASLFKTMAEVDIKKIEQEKIKPREIPWKYTFLNPSTVDIIGGQLSSFANIKKYAINIPDHLKKIIKNPKTTEEKEIVKSLPKEIIAAAKNNKMFILPEDKTLVFHYKKDDWQDWAVPMTYRIMDDILLLEKLKLTDSAALDGAISNVRIFTLGSLEHGIAPSPAAASKLKSVLENHVGGGTIDIVWGPDLKMQESQTDIHKFLGQEKYVPTLNNIYGGIGIPPTLTGAFSANGTTNNFISLKTLIQRLQYGRDVLSSFWQKEIEIVQKAMGFSEPATIEYDYPDLGDSDSEKALLIQMSDRNLISDELLQERFGHNTRMENSRIARENSERASKKRVPKAGPFYESQPDIQYAKIALQSGQLSPEQVGLEFEGKSRDITKLSSLKQPNKKGVPQQGRPKNSNDITKRKTKKFSPKTKASIKIWAQNAQSTIAEVVNPAILNHFSKKNMRSLTTAEQKIAEKLKLGVLFNIKPFSALSKEDIVKHLQDDTKIADDIINIIQKVIRDSSIDLNRKLVLSEVHQIYTDIYADIFSDGVKNANTNI